MSDQNPLPNHEYDTQWKLIIEELFQEFVAFFLPGLYKRIDFSHAPVSIEKEFQRLVYQNENNKGKVVNDKLMRVRLKTGTDHYVLIHIEVQSSRAPKLPYRMFKYFYRIRDKYKHDVTAIAIYTNKHVIEPCNRYEYDFEGTKLIYEFNAYKVKEPTKAELLASTNPFALVILASQYLNETMTDYDKRVHFKLKLVEFAYKKQYTVQQIVSLLTFIEFMLILPEDIKLEYAEKFDHFMEKIETMPAHATTIRMFKTLYEKVLGESVEDYVSKEAQKQLLLKEKEAQKQLLLQEREAQEQLLLKENQATLKLLKMGLSPEKIATALDISLEKVLEIQAKQG